MNARRCSSVVMAASPWAAATRSMYVRSTAPRTRCSAATPSTPALTSKPTWRYRLPGGTSGSSAASWLVVSARSPRNAWMIRSRIGWRSRSALAIAESYQLLPYMVALPIMIMVAQQGPLLAALVPLLVVVVCFDVFCLVDVVRAEKVSYLPRWAWAVLCLVVSPWAGIVYLAIGRSH